MNTISTFGFISLHQIDGGAATVQSALGRSAASKKGPNMIDKRD